jgi:hypothetical protein
MTGQPANPSDRFWQGFFLGVMITAVAAVGVVAFARVADRAGASASEPEPGAVVRFAVPADSDSARRPHELVAE